MLFRLSASLLFLCLVILSIAERMLKNSTMIVGLFIFPINDIHFFSMCFEALLSSHTFMTVFVFLYTFFYHYEILLFCLVVSFSLHLSSTKWLEVVCFRGFFLYKLAIHVLCLFFIGVAFFLTLIFWHLVFYICCILYIYICLDNKNIFIHLFTCLLMLSIESSDELKSYNRCYQIHRFFILWFLLWEF